MTETRRRAARIPIQLSLLLIAPRHESRLRKRRRFQERMEAKRERDRVERDGEKRARIKYTMLLLDDDDDDGSKCTLYIEQHIIDREKEFNGGSRQHKVR